MIQVEKLLELLIELQEKATFLFSHLTHIANLFQELCMFVPFATERFFLPLL